jgi:hypothetical protein
VISSAERERWRSERLGTLRTRVEFLEAERVRYERLLGEALKYAAHHTGVGPWTLLEVLAETHRVSLSTPLSSRNASARGEPREANAAFACLARAGRRGR